MNRRTLFGSNICLYDTHAVISIKHPECAHKVSLPGLSLGGGGRWRSGVDDLEALSLVCQVLHADPQEAHSPQGLQVGLRLHCLALEEATLHPMTQEAQVTRGQHLPSYRGGRNGGDCIQRFRMILLLQWLY